MTPAEDAYVSEWFASLEDIGAAGGHDPDKLRRLILVNRLPLASYIRTDGAQMFSRDLLELPRRAGGYDQLPLFFAGEFGDPAAAIMAWSAYLDGRFVCLRSVTPEAMKRKDELVDAIEGKLSQIH